MPLAQRRPALLKLTLPHPPLSCLPASSSNSTANNINNLTTAMTTSPDSNPITPVNRRRDSSNYAHHRTSIDSWCSSISNESSMGAEYEWTPTQLQTLCKTLEGLPSHLFTPYVGSVPPQNILQKLALGIKDVRGPTDWPHSVRSTRQMLYKLASKLAVPPSLADAAEEAANELGNTPPADATNTPPKRARASRMPMYRKNSMDELLPSTPEVAGKPTRSTKENSHIARASTRLQHRADRFFTFHPYANPARNRDSVISAVSTSNSDPTSGAFRAPLDCNVLPPPRQRLRRTASSTSSQLAIVEEGVVPMALSTPISLSPAVGAPPSSFPSNLPPTLARITHRTSNPCMTRVRPQRSASFNRPLSTGPTVFSNDITETLPADCMGAAAGTGDVRERVTLKRAPSYGVVAQQKKDEAQKAKEQQHLSPPKAMDGVRSISPGIYSSDEEEKRRGKTVKRMKTMTRQPSFLGPELNLRSQSSNRDFDLPSCRAQPQTISVETFTMGSMSSLESLPSLSSSSSVTQLSMRSVETSKTRDSSKSKLSSSSKRERTKSPKDQVHHGKSKAIQSPPTIQVTPMDSNRATSASPPRTLRRVGNKSLKLQPLTAADLLLSPSLPTRPPQPPPKIRTKGLGEIGRKISFGSLGEPEKPKKRTSDVSAVGGGLLGAALGLNSPFEEKPKALPKQKKSAWSSSASSASSAVGPSCKPPVKYLF
ncbi:hypothetical protein M407DRAFT_210099 [Tulasnella calospora MUT 4182]|uniref:Uncharacterized protein n=1 Tax=Tulasnella calospora MUT 4182 TaxID=1051891 RepID=A0A0C3MM04_9AGAM|nr:hypothetical protein M407DRAFT_210099 [Tulasnella calospora MUT 4182]